MGLDVGQPFGLARGDVCAVEEPESTFVDGGERAMLRGDLKDAVVVLKERQAGVEVACEGGGDGGFGGCGGCDA